MNKMLSFLTIIGLSLGLTMAQEKAKEIKPAAKDPVKELKDSWKALQVQVTQHEANIKDQALQIQNVHIQMREAKLQMKDIEAKLQSKLCDKGTTLVIGAADFSCSAPEKEGKPK